MKNEFIIKGNVTEITVISKTYGKHIVLIDTSDLPKLEGKLIGARAKGTKHHIKIYFYVMLNGKSIQLHKYILGYYGNEVIDHLNGKPSDNRNKNLKITTHAENSKNRKVNNYESNIIPALLIEIKWKKSIQRWEARKMVYGKFYQKRFKTKHDAIIFFSVAEPKAILRFIK